MGSEGSEVELDLSNVRARKAAQLRGGYMHTHSLAPMRFWPVAVPTPRHALMPPSLPSPLQSDVVTKYKAAADIANGKREKCVGEQVHAARLLVAAD
jgi:hypothetical protein